MSKFSDYKEPPQENYSKHKNETRANEKNYEELIHKYSKLSNEELMREFLNLTAKEKGEGKLKESELEGIKNTLSPYLDDTQKNNLDSLLNMVRDVK